MALRTKEAQLTSKPELRQYTLGRDSKKDWMGIKGDNRRSYANKTCEHTDFLYQSLRYIAFLYFFSFSSHTFFNTPVDVLSLVFKPFLTFIFP